MVGTEPVTKATFAMGIVFIPPCRLVGARMEVAAVHLVKRLNLPTRYAPCRATFHRIPKSDIFWVNDIQLLCQGLYARLPFFLRLVRFSLFDIIHIRWTLTIFWILALFLYTYKTVVSSFLSCFDRLPFYRHLLLQNKSFCSAFYFFYGSVDL